MIAAAVGQKDFYQADIGDHANNQFAQQLNITSDRYIRGSWCEVMCKLAAHLAEEQVHTLVANGAAVLQENGATQDEITAFRDIAHRTQRGSTSCFGPVSCQRSFELGITISAANSIGRRVCGSPAQDARRNHCWHGPDADTRADRPVASPKGKPNTSANPSRHWPRSAEDVSS